MATISYTLLIFSFHPQPEYQMFPFLLLEKLRIALFLTDFQVVNSLTIQESRKAEEAGKVLLSENGRKRPPISNIFFKKILYF